MIIPSERTFIPDKKIAEDKNTITYKGHLGAEFYSETLGTDVKFLWAIGLIRKVNKHHRSWKKNLRFIKNKSKGNRAFSSNHVYTVPTHNSRRI